MYHLYIKLQVQDVVVDLSVCNNLSQEAINDMDEFIQDTVLKDYPDMNESNEDSYLTPMLVSGEVTRKRPSTQKQSNQVCLFLNAYFS